MSDGPILTLRFIGDPLSLTRIFVAGCITGVATTIITTPVELVKARLQIQYNQTQPGQTTFSGPGGMAKHIIKQEGIAGLFRGTSATLWRDVPGTGIWFAAYEAIRRGFAAQAGCKPSEIGSFKTLIAGGSTGLIMWLCVFPIDVVKSRVQTAASGTYAPGTRGMIKCGIQLFKETGVAGLYKGITPALIRSFPANAACFLAQDVTTKFLNKI
jgi:solute carrier family 25 carnitine/acylcarnitine transporter 20/29